MQSSSAAEADQREVTRVVATLDRNHAKGALHGCVGNGDDAPREIERLFEPCVAGVVPAGRAPQEFGEALLGRPRVEPVRSSQEVVRIEPAENQVRVRHRRSLAATTVAHWSGHRTRAFRADAQGATRVETRERPATRAHGMNVKHRDCHGQTTQRGLVGRASRAPEQANVGRSSAHVKADAALDA